MGSNSRQLETRGHGLGWLTVVTLIGACGFNPSFPEGTPCGEGDACPPGQTCTAERVCRSAEPAEADAAETGPDSDIPVQDPLCARADGDALFHVNFENADDPYRELVNGEQVGEVRNNIAPGESQCGMASATFAGESALVFANAEVWDQVQSLDATVRVQALPDAEVSIASRDASGTAQPGHFGLRITADGRVYLRLQNGGTTHLCSEPGVIVAGQWHRVGVNLGEPGAELWVDGVQALAAGQAGNVNCDERGDVPSIAGNTEPMVLGADTSQSAAGTPDPLQLPLQGQIDVFVASSSRKVFAP